MKINSKIRRDINERISKINGIKWDKPGKAITEIVCMLSDFGITLPQTISFDDYRETADFRYFMELEGQDVDHVLVFSWFRFSTTGRYEINAYVS
jgi:hypothetical protein